MNSVLISTITMGSIGLIFSVIISVFYQKFKVEVDPRIEEITGLLPGNNCGACGFPGCGGYAVAIVKNGVPINQCPVGGAGLVDQIARIMGVESKMDVKKMVARIFCQGDNEHAAITASYAGVKSCTMSHIVGGGGKLCDYGCLGLGDCVRACPFDAIEISDKGLPVVDEEKCTGCGLCAKACPRDVISVEPADRKIFVFCRSEYPPKLSRQLCSIACVGCGLCYKLSPEGIVKNGYIASVIDEGKISEEVLKKCPTGALSCLER